MALPALIKAMILLVIKLITLATRANLGAGKRYNSPKDDQAMTTRRATDNAKALAAFMTTKAQIDAMLERLQGLSDDHFNTQPDEINWGDVGTLNHYASLLREITNSAFNEGEYAE